MRVEAQALITYVCYLKEEDKKKIEKYAEENGVSLDGAIRDLWSEGKIDIYDGLQEESECQTQSIRFLD